MRRWLGRAARVLRWAGIAVTLLIVLAVGAFGLLQTSPGRDWVADMAMRAASGPGFAVKIEGLEGSIPFSMHVSRVSVADGRGVWLTLGDIVFDLTPADLLS